MSPLRTAAFLTGLWLLAAAAHVTIMYSGGYTAPNAILTICIALGVCVAALAIGAAWALGRSVVAGWLVVAILAGEAFGLLMTAERLVGGREATQAPLREAEEARTKATKRVADAEKALTAISASSARLDAAVAAKAAADSAVREKSAQPGCAANCRVLLQDQVGAAQAEITAARDEIDKARTKGETELREATSALASLKAAVSATPLADRTGIPAWVLDLIAAALGSMAANGLGVGLIAFAAHGRNAEPRRGRDEIGKNHLPTTVGDDYTALPATSRRKRVVRIAEHAAQFAVEELAPTSDNGAELIEIHRAYEGWCNSKGVDALPAAKIGGALAKLFAGTGVTFAEVEGRQIVLGVAVKRIRTQRADLMSWPGPAYRSRRWSNSK